MEIKKFLGLNNVTSPERFKPGELALATDMEIDNTGRLMSRRGKAVINATPSHSVFSYDGGAFLSQGVNIYGVEADLTLTLAKVLTSSAYVAYDFTLGVAYFSNGTDVGRFVGRTYKTWGVTPPVSQPVCVATNGNLRAGRYMYAMTYLRSDGHESGTGLAAQTDLTATGGLRLNGLEVSSNVDVTSKAIYVSTRDGEIMYLATVIPNAQTAVVISDEPSAGIPLTTQFAGPPPPGTIVRIFNGIAYVVSGNMVYYSDPYNFELFRPDNNFLQFPGTVSLFDWVNTGIYAATSDSEGDGDEGMGLTWFLAGGRPDQFNPKQVFNYGATPGTSCKVESGWFGPQVERIGEPALIWASRHGVCVGNDGGSAHNLTESRYSFPSAQYGAALVRQNRGFVQYLVTMQGVGSANNAYVETI